MSDNKVNEGANQFWLNKVYPDASESFQHYQRSVENIKDDCLVLLDANVLLMPYKLGAQSISEISKVYRKLSAERRIFLPGQAVREFLKNRADKLRDIARDLNNQASNISIPTAKKTGFLEEDDDYKNFIRISENIKNQKDEALVEIRKITTKLKSDIGSDPLSAVYREIFKDLIYDIPTEGNEQTKIVKDMQWRYEHNIPPGYKDRSKPDDGIGDLLIWKTLLQIGKEKNLDCIFVTEDSKSDWWVQSEGGFQPRMELVEEYRRETQGKTIHLMPLSDLLRLYDVQMEVVDEAKSVEADKKVLAADLAKFTNYTKKIMTLRQFDGYDLEGMDRRSILNLSSEISQKFRSLSRELSRVNQKLKDSVSLEKLSDDEISNLFAESSSLKEEFLKTLREIQKIDKYLSNIFG